MKQLFSNRYSLTFRFFLLLFLSIILIITDAHFYPFKKVRFYLDTIVSPLYFFYKIPSFSVDYFNDLSKTKKDLLTINKKLEIENIKLKAANNLLESLKKDNQDLRKLMKSPSRQDKFKMLSEVLIIDSDLYNFQIVLNKGEKDGVFNGQPVVDDKGILGQIYKTSYSTSRAILICDYQHSIPVRNLRNNQTMVSIGNGCDNDLVIDYIQNNDDVKVGDELVSSGLDGVFPTGYPVARVSKILKNIKGDNIKFFATPNADMKNIRYVLLMWNESQDPPLISLEDN